MKSTSDAIDRAKGFFARIPDEPLVTSEFVLLREVIHALEILWSYTDEELQYGIDNTSQMTVLSALREGALIARVYREGAEPRACPIIPRISWPTESDDKYSDVSSSYWISDIRYDQDCRGYVGELPFVPHPEAVSWLTSQSSEPTRVGRPDVSSSAADAYWLLYPQGHSSAGKSWKEANRAVNEKLGKAVSLSTLKRGVGAKK